jgi:hypothetical protein
MAAGLGFKTFTTGEVLTAADTNGYLMQGINVFASTAARDAAITSPQEGQFAFTKDTNGLWYYDGAAWVASGATGDIEGVTAGIGISGGGTSGTVTVTNSMATAIDAKGDLVPGTGADTFSRLAVGANDTVLTADSTTATGLKWAAAVASGSNFSLINSGGTALTGATSITVSGISAKNKLWIFISEASQVSTGGYITMTINADATAKYGYAGRNDIPQATYSTAVAGAIWVDINAASGYEIAGWATAANSTASAGILIDGCNSSGVKIINAISGVSPGSGANPRHYNTQGIYTGTSTVSSIKIATGAGNFDGGTIYIYGSTV